MSLNINEELAKLIKIVGDDAFDCRLNGRELTTHHNSRINFLWKVLISTIKYPQIELYLKDLLNYFTIDEIKNTGDNWSILHYMSQYPYHISLGTFKIIINYGISVNIMNKFYYTPGHLLVENSCNNHINSILNLFIEHGINLNIKNMQAKTILDKVSFWQEKLNEETKNCIMRLVDFGAITNNPMKNNQIYDFIEYYKNSTIKPAIKK